jgi:chromosome segregation ATPase
VKELTWDMILQAAAFVGTGGWLGYVVKGHGRRLTAMKKSLEDIERALPAELEKRLRTIEQEKLGVNDHGRICSAALKSVEVMVAGMKETLEQHASRLGKGDDLFRELSMLAGEMRAAMNHARKNGVLGGPG